MFVIPSALWMQCEEYFQHKAKIIWNALAKSNILIGFGWMTREEV
jgi:hypothetical protein